LYEAKDARSAQSRQYVCIDLKSFYASVECVERGLDPLTTNLVVADSSRTDKTICLAVSPSLKALGVRNRCRLFEVPSSLDFIIAPPRMQLYIDYSARIYGIYLKFVSKDDIHVYSVDEAFIDVTPYLAMYGMTARELGEAMRSEITRATGIPATCGLGTNLYLAKVALDITAKRQPDFFGELTEESYRNTLWEHRPLTDFWRIGPGIAARLARIGVDTMRGVAFAPPDVLYHMFGVDAEILIDHAWGREPVTIADIKAYRPRAHSVSTAQVFGCDYCYDDALLVAKEMADALSLELVRRGLVAGTVMLAVGYRGIENAGRGAQDSAYLAHHTEDRARQDWGLVWTHASRPLPLQTNSLRLITEGVSGCFSDQVARDAKVHRLALALDDVAREDDAHVQMTLFVDEDKLDREHRRQLAVKDIKDKFGRSSILKAMDLLPNAKARERNGQIGGHRSGVE
jgi:DNA polymerase V